jgi:hypothetical protein
MGFVTNQVKRVVDALKAAGFKRSEFRVNVNRHMVKGWNGHRYAEYGDACIVVLADAETQFAHLPAVLEQSGIDVSIWRTGTGWSYPHYAQSSSSRKGQLIITDMSQTEITYTDCKVYQAGDPRIAGVLAQALASILERRSQIIAEYSLEVAHA